eukprot:6172000-Pleurochrysis_carterae.AAC.2
MESYFRSILRPSQLNGIRFALSRVPSGTGEGFYRLFRVQTFFDFGPTIAASQESAHARAGVFSSSLSRRTPLSLASVVACHGSQLLKALLHRACARSPRKHPCKNRKPCNVKLACVLGVGRPARPLPRHRLRCALAHLRRA